MRGRRKELDYVKSVFVLLHSYSVDVLSVWAETYSVHNVTLALRSPFCKSSFKQDHGVITTWNHVVITSWIHYIMKSWSHNMNSWSHYIMKSLQHESFEHEIRTKWEWSSELWTPVTESQCLLLLSSFWYDDRWTPSVTPSRDLPTWGCLGLEAALAEAQCPFISFVSTTDV